MTKEFFRYRQLEQQLWMTRWRHSGDESSEEDALVEEMDAAWWQLSEDEQALLNSEGPRCWPMDGSIPPPQFAESRPASTSEAWRYEGFLSPLDAIQSAA